MRRFLTLCLLLSLFTTFAAGCGGGGAGSTVSSNGQPVVSSVGKTPAIPDPPAPLPACRAGDSEPLSQCGGCPAAYISGSFCNYPAQMPPGSATLCPAGESLVGQGICCPTGDALSSTGTCVAPAPIVCPVDTYGTPPTCTPIPQCSAVVGGYWGGPAVGCVCPAGQTGTYPACKAPACPAGDTGTYPNCVPPPACDALPGAYWGGNACVCPAGTVGQYPQCIAQTAIAFNVSANLDPTTVTDTGPGSSPSGTAAVFSWSVTSNVPGDSWTCQSSATGTSLVSSPISVSGYSALQDGPQTVSVTCTDAWNAHATTSVQLNVVPPPQAPPDQFTCFANGNSGTVTCTWVTYEPGAECEVVDLSTLLVLTGSSGGPTGNVTTGTLFQPTLFALQCNTGTTASPNPVGPVSP